MSKRLGMIRHSYARSLFEGLESGDSPIQFDLEIDAPASLSLKLLQDSLDGAFLSPIEFAKHASQLIVINNFCISSMGESQTIELHFKEDLLDIESVAIHPESSSEAVLAKIILAEKFDVAPQLIAVQQASREALKKADAVLAVGDDCLLWDGHPTKIDLVDEWFDITELPYAHGFLAAKEGSFDSEEIAAIMKVILAESSGAFEFSYRLDEQALAGIQEFFKMAYYYGILKDIPDLRLLE